MLYNSKLAERKAVHEKLVTQMGALPTLDELAEAWGCSRITASSYQARNKGRFPTRRKRRSCESYEEVYLKRLRIYQKLATVNGRPPTYRELAEAWCIESGAVNSYLGYLARRNRALPVSIYLCQKEQVGRVRRTLPSVIAQIRSHHNIDPSASELALLYGISKQRIMQVIDALSGEGEVVRIRDGRPTIRWDVGTPE